MRFDRKRKVEPDAFQPLIETELSRAQQVFFLIAGIVMFLPILIATKLAPNAVIVDNDEFWSDVPCPSSYATYIAKI
jgi:hypothetical protein